MTSPAGMLLSAGFQFSQASLQTFVDCPLCFKYRYIDRLAWPAVEAEPQLEFERLSLQGRLFHRMAQQHRVGLDLDRLMVYAREFELADWWENYCSASPRLFAGLEGQFFPEIRLTGGLYGFRLVAKYDLIFAVKDGRALIIDWKTSRGRTRRAILAQRLQTRLYPCLLVQAGAALNGGQRYAPEQIEMVYWFAGFPEQPECFHYTPGQFKADESYLGSLMTQISQMEAAAFLPADHSGGCRFCVYRSLCGRGERAGQLDELDAEPEDARPADDLNLDQVLEIAY